MCADFFLLLFYFARANRAALNKQPELLHKLRKQMDVAVGAREEEHKQLKQDVAHFRAASDEASRRAEEQGEILKLLEALTNASFKREGEKFMVQCKNLQLEPTLSFLLRVDEAGAVHYDPVTLAVEAPSFFRDSIVFQKGQAVIFFREVLKLLSREQ